jgi:NAD(P)-dependent dehydrogenase (short-subunit alcohol dehydrogenase family)
MKTLKDKVVVITGAGSGIGRALALSAAKEGAVLALSDWNETGVFETERLARAPRSIARRVDVRSDEAVQAFAAEVGRDLGGAHVVVNNAGVSLSDTVGSMKRADFEWVMDIDFWGVVRGTEAFLPQLREKDDAHVVNVSSVFGLIGVPSQSAYNAAKFAVRGYTEALRNELHGTAVHVTCVHPGGVKTNIVKNGRANKNSFGASIDTPELAREFEKVARLSPESAARIIWSAVRSNAPRVLVGADAHLIDAVVRLFPSGYQGIFRAIQGVAVRAMGLRGADAEPARIEKT